jgi:hypothetical protein
MNVGVVFGDIGREIVISGHDHVYGDLERSIANRWKLLDQCHQAF